VPRIELVTGDITAERVDAIVNAANSSLLGGGGVDGAIHRAGGPSILAECRELRATTWVDGLPAGEAVATGAGRLHARWVIHTVGPVWPGPGAEAEARRDVLRAAYRNSLGLASRLGAASLATARATAAASSAGPDATPGRVRFVLFSSRMHDEFRTAAGRLGIAVD